MTAGHCADGASSVELMLGAHNVREDAEEGRYSTVQHSTVQYSIVQYSTVQYSTVQYSTVQYCSLYSAHPVLGTVMAVWALEELEPGTEVTTHYGYTDPGLYGDMGIQTGETEEESCSQMV